MDIHVDKYYRVTISIGVGTEFMIGEGLIRGDDLLYRLDKLGLTVKSVGHYIEMVSGQE